MKFAFMSFSCPDLSLSDMLALAKDVGYDGVEPRTASNHAHGIELTLDQQGRDAARKEAESAGIPFACIATSCRYADPATRDGMITETHQYIDLAADVGAPCIRVFGGAIPEGISREDATQGLVDSFKAVAEHAADRGVYVCMETHDHWCDPQDVANVMKLVDHPNIQVNWDIMHPVRVTNATMEQAFNALRPWIKHCHFHDGVTTEGKLEMVPIGEGIIDHKTAVQLLNDIGWDGYMSGEWINWEPYEQHLPRELETMKGYDV